MRIVVRVRRAPSRLGRFVGVSAGAHAAAVVVMVFVTLLQPKADFIPMDAAFVELSGAISLPASGPAAPASPSPPPPEPAPQPPEPEGAHAVEKIPEPVKPKDDKKKDEKKKETKKPEPPRPTPPNPGPQTPGPPGPATPGNAGPPGVSTGTAGITSLDATDPGLSWYNAAVAGALENAWVKPVLEGVGTVQSVVVAFEIGSEGNAFNLRIDVSSGIPSLDRSALRAVQDAAPFPPPPPAARASSVRQRIRFDLRPETR